jgi:hypothetical protein
MNKRGECHVGGTGPSSSTASLAAVSRGGRQDDGVPYSSDRAAELDTRIDPPGHAGNAERAHVLDVAARSCRRARPCAAARSGANVTASNVAGSSTAIASVAAQQALTKHLHRVARDG